MTASIIGAGVWATLSVLIVMLGVCYRRWTSLEDARRQHTEALRRVESLLEVSGRVRVLRRCCCGSGWLPSLGDRFADGGVVHGVSVCQPVGEAL